MDKGAKIKKYSSYSQEAVRENLLNTPIKIQNFLEELLVKIKPKAIQQRQKLTEFMQQQTGNKSAILNSWDWSYYQMLYNNKTFQIDDKKI